MINGGLLSLIALYLIAILYNGNEGKMLSLMRENGGFIKWILSFYLLAVIIRLTGGKAGQILQQLAFVGLAALAVKAGETILPQIDKTLKIGDKQNG